MKSPVASRQSPVKRCCLVLKAVRRILSHIPALLLLTGDWRLATILLICLSAPAMNAAERDGRWAILLAGLSGDQDLQNIYMKEITDLHGVLINSLGFPRDHIVVLFDDPSKNPGLIQYKSTRENLQAACLSLAGRIEKEDLIFVFIEGHGSYDGRVYKLNLEGPDPTAEDLAAMLYSIPAQRFVVINATNCSGGSIPALSQNGKIVITATKSGMEQNLTHAGQYFVEAFKNSAADSDKNGRVSIMEAFSYARLKVEDYYSSEGNLQTEHPILDDNGDAKGQSQPSLENGEGFLARVTYLDTGIPASARETLTPEQQKLTLEVQELEKKIEALKYAKGQMTEAEYEQKLEELLLRLARINAKLPQ